MGILNIVKISGTSDQYRRMEYDTVLFTKI